MSSDETLNAVIAEFDLRERDCREALMEHWKRSIGEPFSLDLVLGLSIVNALMSTALTAFYYIKERLGLPALIFAALAGYWVNGALRTARTLRVRHRLAREYWDEVQLNGTHVRLLRSDAGLVFERGSLHQSFDWLAVRRVFTTASKRLWVCWVGDVVYWVPVTAFPSAKAFHTFTRDASLRLEGARPSGKAFEVIHTTPA